VRLEARATFAPLQQLSRYFLIWILRLALLLTVVALHRDFEIFSTNCAETILQKKKIQRRHTTAQINNEQFPAS
jgi:hypothetical protein